MDAQKNTTMNVYSQVFAVREQHNAEGKSRLDQHIALQNRGGEMSNCVGLC